MARRIVRRFGYGSLVFVMLVVVSGSVVTATGDRMSAATSCSGSASCPVRISFPPGAFSGQITSRLTGITSERWFVLRASAGQTMVVVVEGAGPTRGEVLFPSGEQNGQPGGRVFDGRLPVSGDYRIRVTESQMGEGWSGPVTVVALIY
jgi:hypothetical protein